MAGHSKDKSKNCDSINIVEMVLICIILYFFYDLLIIEKTEQLDIVKLVMNN